jgi:hypothetical protein
MAVHRRHRDMRQDVKVTADEAGKRKKAVSAATYNDERPAKKRAAQGAANQGGMRVGAGGVMCRSSRNRRIIYKVAVNDFTGSWH